MLSFAEQCIIPQTNFAAERDDECMDKPLTVGH